MTTALSFQRVLMLMAIVGSLHLHTARGTNRDLCSDYYSPCSASCADDLSNAGVTCTNVTVQDVQAAFLRTPILDHTYVELRSMECASIPADLLADKRTAILQLSDVSGLRSVHVDAFRSSQDYMSQFSMLTLDTSQEACADLFDALAGFPIQFMTLGYTRTPFECQQFPAPISTLHRLSSLMIRSQVLRQLPARAFSPAVKLASLHISSPFLTVVPAAFEGDFSDAYIFIGDNNLTSLEYDVFHDLLQSMVGSAARLDIDGYERFACHQCQMAWLLRDNRQLLSKVSGYCQNPNVPFDSFDYSVLADCPDI